MRTSDAAFKWAHFLGFVELKKPAAVSGRGGGFVTAGCRRKRVILQWFGREQMGFPTRDYALRRMSGGYVQRAAQK